MSNPHPTPTRQQRTGRRFNGQRWLSIVILAVSALACGDAIAGVTGPHLLVTGSDKAAAVTVDNQRQDTKLALRTKVVDGPLVPGVQRTLRVRLLNHLPHRLIVKKITVDAKRPDVAGCKPRWVLTSSFHASNKHDALRIKADGKSVVRLGIRLKDLPYVNQDACKGSRFPLLVSATAWQQ